MPLPPTVSVGRSVELPEAPPVASACARLNRPLLQSCTKGSMRAASRARHLQRPPLTSSLARGHMPPAKALLSTTLGHLPPLAAVAVCSVRRCTEEKGQPKRLRSHVRQLRQEHEVASQPVQGYGQGRHVRRFRHRLMEPPAARALAAMPPAPEERCASASPTAKRRPRRPSAEVPAPRLAAARA